MEQNAWKSKSFLLMRICKLKWTLFIEKKRILNIYIYLLSYDQIEEL